ncbi:MAG: hypothetical protein FWC23_09395 [Chitinispirillia bacterium]|nr:hypothetical protein [Chitinispirillia bacterium]MCL2269382.1 hypothetical protein [Chitinispirillia bacterium]
MTDLTRKMLDDYKPFIKEGQWPDFVKTRLETINEIGPIVNILKVYSTDGKRLLEKVYQCEGALGTPYGLSLNSAQAGVDSLPD